MTERYTKSSLENRVAQYYEELYAETFPSGGANGPVSIKDLDPMLRAFEHRMRGAGYSKALDDLNDIDGSLWSWGHYNRLVDMRTDLEDENVGSQLSNAERAYNAGRLGVAFIFLADRPRAETFLQKAEAMAENNNDQESAGSWAVYRALNFTISGDLQAAKNCLEDAKKKIGKKKNKAYLHSVEGYMNIGVLGYHDVMNSKETLRCYNESVQLYDEILGELDIEARAFRTFTYLHRARGYTLLGQHDEAKGDFEEAHKEFEALGNQRVLVYLNTIEGSAKREQGYLAQAKNAIEHAQRVSIAIGDRRGEQVTNSLLGKIHRDAAWAIRIKKDDFTEAAIDHLHAAAHHFEQALEIERVLGNRARLEIVLRRLGNVRRDLCRALENDGEAKEFASLALEHYAEAAKVASDELPASNARRTTIYDWLEESRNALTRTTPGKLPNALRAQRDLQKDSGPVVVPPVELELGIELLRDKDAYKSDKPDIDSAEKAFAEAADLLERALGELAEAEKDAEDKEKDLKRRAEINYALGTALVGQAVLADKKRRGNLEEQALKIYGKLLGDKKSSKKDDPRDAYKSPGFVRDTYQDLVAIREAVGSSKFVDECLTLFRDNWNPESLGDDERDT